MRVSLGGMRDEAEIRGIDGPTSERCRARSSRACGGQSRRIRYSSSTRSTSSGPTFAAILRRRCSKCSTPKQNNTFRDHYLDVPFDLSEVLFITTANILDPVPPALKDRMEVLEIAGYTEEEKLKIATDHLVDKQVKNHGLTADYIRFTPDALRQVIRGYTREAGVQKSRARDWRALPQGRTPPRRRQRNAHRNHTRMSS